MIAIIQKIYFHIEQIKLNKTFAHDRTLQKFQCEVNGCVYDTVTKECCTLDNYQNTHCIKKDNCNLD
jgi:hypothetical protein